MRHLGTTPSRPRGRSRGTTYFFALAASVALGAAAGAAGCGDNGESTTSNTSTGASGGTGGTGGTGATGAATSSSAGATGGTGGTGGSDAGGKDLCKTTATGPTRGSAIAITADDKRLVVTNRDSGSVTVMAVDYASGPKMTVVKDANSKDEIDLGAGSEPWQVVTDSCGTRAYVVLRQAQKVVEIEHLDTVPTKGLEVSVGSEPTGIAISPNNSKLYVANMVDGTITEIDALTMTKIGNPIDLNAPLVAHPKAFLGTVTARAGLAHPRSIAVSNDGDTNDGNEKLYVTEYFAQQSAALDATASNADVNREGLVYTVTTDAAHTVKIIELGAIADTGFKDSKGNNTGCFPNQLQSITLSPNGKFAYVTSICASPVGPLGAFQKGACTSNAQCNGGLGTCVVAPAPGAGSCAGSCVLDSDCGFQSPVVAGTCDVANGGACKVIPTNFKTTTHPVVSVIDTSSDTEAVTATTTLDKVFLAGYNTDGAMDDKSRRFPLIPNDISFLPGSGVGYLSANGVDAVFRLRYDPSTSAIVEFGNAAPAPDFIDLSPASIPAGDPKLGQNPVGVVVANTHAFMFSANDVTRNVSAIDLAKQLVAGSDVNDARVTGAAALPAPGSPAESQLKGKHFFNTGLGIWSFKGQGWGSCQACHVDGLTDNVTWYFARGPRQSTSVDGSFASTDPTDRRIFNWTGIFDEMQDFENNTRGVSGGIGALVTTLTPTANTDRINIASAAIIPPEGAVGLAGSTIDVATNVSPLHAWNDLTAYTTTVRSPRAVSTLDPVKVTAGETIFKDLAQGGVCQGCHGGAKWTISKVFYTPSANANPAVNTNVLLRSKAWTPPAGFPAALLPATTAANQLMRFSGAPPPAAVNGNLDQLLCILRPVGTFGANAGVGGVEVRADMVTTAQGNATDGKGYNPPSLLNLQLGAPYFHGGNARTLEELFTPAFGAHWKALTANVNFLLPAGDIDKLVAYLLSIDEGKPMIAAPAAAGATGGDFCTQ